MNVCKERSETSEGETFLSLFFLSLHFFFFPFCFLFSSSTIPSLCRLSTNVSRKRFTSYHGVTPRRWNTIIRVSPGILEGSFTPFASFAWVRVTSFTDQLLLSLLPFFFFFPRKNLVRKCPSVVVKSNPDLISVPPIHSRPFRIREENNEENIYIYIRVLFHYRYIFCSIFISLIHIILSLLLQVSKTGWIFVFSSLSSIGKMNLILIPFQKL